MQLGIDSFVTTSLAPENRGGGGDARRVAELLEEIRLADRVGLDVYAIGEHHRLEFIASSPAVLLAAAALQTRRIRLASAVSVLSTDDPIRLFQQFSTLDLISEGRAEIIVGRGSFTESFPLFGHDLRHYDLLFSEKLDLLLKLRDETHPHWSGRHRAPLSGEGVYPRPVQTPLPIRLGVGGSPDSFVRAGRLGLPLVVAIIGGQPRQFRPLIDAYRAAGRKAGHAPERLSVAVHAHGFLADTRQEAIERLYPSWQAAFTQIGKERGWPPASRAHFDAACSDAGALLIGDPDTVARKIARLSETLGGLDRVTLAINGGYLMPHTHVLRAIELLGERVAPLLRGQGVLQPAMA